MAWPFGRLRLASASGRGFLSAKRLGPIDLKRPDMPGTKRRRAKSPEADLGDACTANGHRRHRLILSVRASQRDAELVMPDARLSRKGPGHLTVKDTRGRIQFARHDVVEWCAGVVEAASCILNNSVRIAVHVPTIFPASSTTMI